jgi:hypothetical protein
MIKLKDSTLQCYIYIYNNHIVLIFLMVFELSKHDGLLKEYPKTYNNP